MTNVIKTFWVNTVAYFQGMKEMKLRTYFDDWSAWEKGWLDGLTRGKRYELQECNEQQYLIP